MLHNEPPPEWQAGDTYAYIGDPKNIVKSFTA
jgi:hypothetical protein